MIQIKPLRDYTVKEVRDICKAATHCPQCRFSNGAYCPFFLSYDNKDNEPNHQSPDMWLRCEEDVNKHQRKDERNVQNQ